MLPFPAGFKIYLAVEPVDMRKQFNGLWALAGEKLREDPKSGSVFGFCNKDRDRVKLLYWDGTGVWVMAKRLEKGRCPAPIRFRGRRQLDSVLSLMKEGRRA